MDTGVRVLVTVLLHQVATAMAQEACIPGFQTKHYQLEFTGRLLKGQTLTQLAFHDCGDGGAVRFLVSHPDLSVDADHNLVVRRDLLASQPMVLIHGLSAHAEDVCQLSLTRLQVSELQDALGPLSRTRRSLLVPPMSITENQRAPFPRIIGRSHVITAQRSRDHVFRLSGPGADLEPLGVFSIDMETGEVSVSRSLDREAIEAYQLEVSLTDLAGNLVDGPELLLVTIIDQNDNRPIFRETRYSGEVLEGSPTGTTVMTMTALDADDPATDNAALRYSIARQSPTSPSPHMFYIHPEGGAVVTLIAPALLDRETLPTTTYELEIVAKDMTGSEVGLTGTATATVTIGDRNDHTPEFTHPLFEARVDEGWRGGVVNLTVDDRDEPATGAWRALYSITSGDPAHRFHIHTNPDNNEGMLSVVKPLDYEDTDVHLLLIRVENEDPLVSDVPYGPSSTATVRVAVLDVNEGPVFSPDPLTVTRMENVPMGSYVATLSATDPDTLQNQNIRYAVLIDPAGWLTVNPVRGTINTSTSLDRESPFVRDNQYTALFIATDNGSPPATGTGTLLLQLEDYNDNAPYVFPAVAQVCEDTQDISVALVGGRDRDITPNAAPFRIELGQQQGLDKTWRVSRVNATHSQIVLLETLKKANYRLPLLITDSGEPPLTNSTELLVQVCVCRKSRMLCSHAGPRGTSAPLLGALVLLQLAAHGL